MGAPPPAERRLVAVHAHPDDESITTGGLLARCADAGVSTCLVTCTDGRYGPVNPDLGLRMTPDRLAATRRDELTAAAKILGVDRTEWLGHHDSGMFGSPCNDRPEGFWAVPVDVPLARLVGIIRDFRPHVVVTYDPYGGTGHPDHIQTHRLTLLAVEAAAEGSLLAGAGPPWRVDRVFYPVFPRPALEEFIVAERREGRSHPFDGRAATEINYARPAGVVTHVVDIVGVFERKRYALQAHRTQVGPHYPQLYRAALARPRHEHFRLAALRGRSDVDFDDVFAPVTGS